MNTKLGTPYYVPPEVLDGKYDKRCDLWSIGVITFILLCGEPPFFGNSTADVFRKIKMCDYEFSQEAWKQISKEARNFIEKLIQPNLKLRMTVEQALEHPWINQKPQEEAGLSEARQRRDERVFKRIKELKSLKRLQQEILLILVSLIDENQFQENKHTFQTIDVDHSGSIDKQELKKALTFLLQERFEDREFDELVDKLDFDKDGQISYSEFLSCTLAKKHLDR